MYLFCFYLFGFFFAKLTDTCVILISQWSDWQEHKVYFNLIQILTKVLSLHSCYVEHNQRKTKGIKKKVLFAFAYIADGWFCLHIKQEKWDSLGLKCDSAGVETPKSTVVVQRKQSQ